MSKYFDTKPGSLEEAVSAAQQAAIAISKKEKGEKPKKENNFIYAAKMAKKNGDKTFTIGSKQYDVEATLQKEEDKLDPVNPKAVKKKFADRKDKDIDNDGDTDSTDKYLHKRRAAISKATEAVSPAQQAAIAISKKERGEKPKNEAVSQDDHGEKINQDKKDAAMKKTDQKKDFKSLRAETKIIKLGDKGKTATGKDAGAIDVEPSAKPI